VLYCEANKYSLSLSQLFNHYPARSQFIYNKCVTYRPYDSACKRSFKVTVFCNQVSPQITPTARISRRRCGQHTGRAPLIKSANATTRRRAGLHFNPFATRSPPPPPDARLPRGTRRRYLQLVTGHLSPRDACPSRKLGHLPPPVVVRGLGFGG